VAGDFSLRYLLEILFRRKRVFLLPLILTPLFAVLISLLIKAEYMSSTTILLGKEEILNPLVRYETAVAMTDTNRLGSFQKIINSRPLIEETIRKLGLDKGLKSDLDMEMMVNLIRKNIHLLGLTGDSFQIACTAPNPVLAKNMVESVSQLFIEKSLQGSRREAMAAVNLIQKEVDHYRQEMESTEQGLQRFRQGNMETLGQINTLGGLLNEYRTKGLDAELELKQERLNESLLSARLAGEKPMVIAQALYVQNTPYQKQYQELQLRMGNLLATREKSHPEVLKLQREMDYITQLLEDEKKKGQASETHEVRSPVYQEVSARLEDGRIKIKVLEQKLAEYQRLQEETRKKLLDVPELEKEQTRMQSELKLTHELYDTLRMKLEQARVTCEVEIAQQANRFTIIDPPVIPSTRHKPIRKLFVIGGIVGGVCLGFFLAFLLEFTDSRLVRTGDLLWRTRLQLVGVLPKLYHFGESEPFHLLIRLRHLFTRLPWTRLLDRLRRVTPSPPPSWGAPLVGPIQQGLRKIFCARRFVLPPDMSANLIFDAQRLEKAGGWETPEEEALDDYLARLRSIAIVARSAYSEPDHLLWMVTSTRAGEGKTLLSANLGTVMARDLKKPVLLVDANLQMPSLSEALGHPQMSGVAEVIEGRASLDDVLIALDTPGLSLLPAGMSTEYPDVLYNSPAFHHLLESLRERFSFTLIEAPDMLTSSGGRLLAPHTDGVLFVVRLYAAKRKPVEAAIQKLPQGKIIGVVFNYFEYWIPDWLYRWI
jgi:polysaccharide chain length determinant protein (PEP-CTERM system associated)